MEPVTIAAIITAASTIGAGAMNASSTASANKQNLQMAMLQRGDTLAAQKTANALARKGMALNERQQAFSEQESALNRAERVESRSYDRMQKSYSRAAEILSMGLTLNQTKAAPFQKYAGRA